MPKDDPYFQESEILKEDLDDFYDEEEEYESEEESVEDFETTSFKELHHGIYHGFNKHLLDGGPNSQFGQTHA